MSSDNVKEQLINATIKLLSESKNPEKITARQIVSEANANLAMINYYFNSKNELLKIALGRIMEERADEMKDIFNKPIPPKDKLLEFLITMIELTLEFTNVTKPIISYALLEGDMGPAYIILPVIREYYGNKRTETECRMVAFQLISALQLTFLRNDQFSEYLGIDFQDKQQRNQFVHTLVNLYL